MRSRNLDIRAPAAPAEWTRTRRREMPLESLDQADQVREQLGRAPIRRAIVVNRAAANTRLAREAEDERRKAGGELAGVVHQRVAFPDAGSRGESVMTSRAAEAAADDQRLWCALKGGKHGSEPQEAKPRTKREAREGRRGLGEGEKRIVADVPEQIHRQVRVKCLQRGVLVRDYILELLAKDGIK